MKTKIPRCKFCEGPHYQTFCPRKPRKTLTTRKPLRASRTSLSTHTTFRAKKPQKPLKRSKMSPQSKSVRRTMIAKADRIFSIYIRLRYNEFGDAYCVTCGVRKPWGQMQNGHFISRRVMALRWDEVNCNVQCPHCNETLAGNLKVYKDYIIREYGEEELQRLRIKAGRTEKISLAEIEAVIQKYTEEVKNLSKTLD